MEAAASAGKLLRAPGLKRGKIDELPADRVKLERVLGLTVACNAALDCDPQTELLAYPAGCTVVLLDARRGRQSHLLNASRKTVSCLSFSADGRYLATGEVGHLPAVRVWDLQEPRTQLAELLGHKFGVVCVAFSPSGKHLVSVGSQHDMIVNVWDWRQGVKLASNKVSARIKAVSFAENGSYFVTVGNRHVKFWYLEHARSAKYKEPVPLMGRSAILGEQRNNHFCDVGCGRGEKGDSTYAVTRSGLLCEFNNRRLLDKWVELRTTSANCMVVGDNYIFIGCAEGIVRCFSPSTLQFITTLPRTHYLGVDVAQGLTISHMGANSGSAHYPDVVALAYDSTANKLSCVYNDHSLYIWDVEDIKRVGKAHSFLHHSACIWGVETYPETGSERLLPPGSFVTCSSDDTVRVWNLDHLESTTGSAYQRNIYSNELLKVLYIDPELTHLKDQTDSKVEGSYDGRNGVRSIRISPDGKHLASGDRSGNVRVHELERLAELCRIEAHDAEVLCLEFSPAGSSLRLLASASRDRLIHVFNVDQGYDFMQTLDDHSSSITAVRFLNGNAHDQLQMVSCGADKSIIFRQLQACEFARGHNAAGKSTLYDMEVDHGQKHILTACQDRNVRVYSAASGKHSKTFRGSVGEEGSLIKVVLDSSGIYAATSCTDKTLCIYDYYSNELMATMFGHSELVTGLRFTNDCRRLISASGDGCIFVWRLPRDMVVTMQARLAQQAARAGRRIPTHNGHLDNEFASLGSDLGDRNANMEEDCRLSAAELPLWATKQTERGQTDTRPTAVELPRGRWAQRIGPSAGISVKSVYDEETIIPFPHQDKRLDSDGGGSKDSSIDSGTETLRQYPDARPGTRPKYKYDGDDESFSDERDHVMYYPANDETGSEFTVNAMDVEELRRSQRRMKNKRADRLMPEMPHITISTSVSGSQDSEEDEEDEASTPGANEPAELSSALSVSTESLEQFRRREKYLVSAFQSLPNAEPATKDPGGSISARHSARNSAVISAARMTRGEGEAESKRDELRKRIEHTRRQLSSVGFRSTLKNSQSICDLSRHDRTNNSSHAAGRYTQMGGDSDEEAEVSGGLRRACSLSDLVSPAPRRNPLQVSGKLKPGGKRYKSSGMSRSTSMLVLNQSDSDGEGGGGGRTVRVNGLMRPTISSLNKMAPGRRGRGLSGAYSTVNLSSVGQPEDSSSEESAKPRPRSSSIDRAAPTPAQRNRAAIRTPTSRTRAGHDEPGLDVTQAPLNAQLCNSVASQLKFTADSVAQLCRRLAADQQSDSTAMLRNLKRAISDAQNTLKTINADAATPDVASVMQQYSDLLLDMVQQNMSKPEAS